MPDAFTVDVSPLDLENHKACVFRLGGSVDASSTQQLEEAVRGELDAGTRLCVLDFSGVDYVSSAGLRLLLKLRRSAADLGGGVKIAGLHRETRENVFDALGFSKLFELYADTDEAVASITGPEGA